MDTDNIGQTNDWTHWTFEKLWSIHNIFVGVRSWLLPSSTCPVTGNFLQIIVQTKHVLEQVLCRIILIHSPTTFLVVLRCLVTLAGIALKLHFDWFGHSCAESADVPHRIIHVTTIWLIVSVNSSLILTVKCRPEPSCLKYVPNVQVSAGRHLHPCSFLETVQHLQGDYWPHLEKSIKLLLPC